MLNRFRGVSGLIFFRDFEVGDGAANVEHAAVEPESREMSFMLDYPAYVTKELAFDTIARNGDTGRKFVRFRNGL